MIYGRLLEYKTGFVPLNEENLAGYLARLGNSRKSENNQGNAFCLNSVRKK